MRDNISKVLSWPPVRYPLRVVVVIGFCLYVAAAFIFACGAWFVEQVKG